MGNAGFISSTVGSLGRVPLDCFKFDGFEVCYLTYIYIYIYADGYAHIYIHINKYIYIQIHIHMHKHTTCVRTHTHCAYTGPCADHRGECTPNSLKAANRICVCILYAYVCMYVCMHVPMYVWLFIDVCCMCDRLQNAQHMLSPFYRCLVVADASS